jgi:hypothetical protein
VAVGATRIDASGSVEVFVNLPRLKLLSLTHIEQSSPQREVYA